MACWSAVKTTAAIPADAKVRQVVEGIIAELRQRGDAAARELSERFDETAARLSLTLAVQAYRDEWLVERDCARRKAAPCRCAQCG